jgi:hypothetical protein
MDNDELLANLKKALGQFQHASKNFQHMSTR